MKPLTLLRAIDDAGLDPYQRAVITHVWRVGMCWERLQVMADKCGMSIGKAHEVKKWLLSHGFLEWTVAENGKAAVVVSIERFSCGETNSLHETIQQNFSPDEIGFSPHETKFSSHENPTIKKANGSMPIEGELGADEEPAEEEAENPQETDPPEQVVMVNALVDATGMSGRLNWGVLSALADDLLEASYRPEDVARGYSDGGWWPSCDWRGKRGDRPTPKQIRETIRAAANWNGVMPELNGRHTPNLRPLHPPPDADFKEIAPGVY
jgi:hypothetical protein